MMKSKISKRFKEKSDLENSDKPIIDLNNSEIKSLLKKGKTTGYITHDQLNKALPDGELTSEQIEDVMVSINELVDITAKVADKVVRKVYDLSAPRGVMGRNSNNDLIKEKLGWEYSMTLEEGIRKTYGWISWEASKEIYSDKNIVGMNVV